MSQDDYTGQILDGKYALTRILGKGGMGAVYLGKHTVLGRQVAVKFLHEELTASEEILKRFYREAQAAAAIGHKNIIDVLDVGVSPGGDPYLVMEYLEGEDLEGLLRRTGPLDLPTACGIIEPALLALSAAHEKGIVHRDLKPANIFLVDNKGEPPTIKLIDFGISKFTHQGDKTKLTQTGSLLGTPAYMAPEQARGLGEIDGRADIYSMGVILYQMLTGALPFEGENYNDLLVRVLTEDPRPPLEAYSGFPMEAEVLVGMALARDPAARPQSAVAMIDALRQLGSYDNVREGMTQLASGIKTHCCAAGDLGGVESDLTSHPSAKSVLSGMAMEGTPNGWAGTEPPRRSSKAALIGVMIAVAVLLLGGLGIFVALGESTDAVSVTAAAPVPVVEEREPEGIEITLSGLPKEATVFYDNSPVPMNPFRVKRAQTIVPVRVEAAGFEPFATSVIPSKDLVVEVEMKPQDVHPGPVESSKLEENSEKPRNQTHRKKKKKNSEDDRPEAADVAAEKGAVVSAPVPASEPKKPAAPKKKLTGDRKGALFTDDFE